MPKIEATSWGLHNSKLVITKMISWDNTDFGNTDLNRRYNLRKNTWN